MRVRDDDGVAEHVREARAVLGLDDVDGAPDRVGREDVSLVEQRDQLLEELRDPFGLLGLAGQRDLVAAHQDVRGERALDELEEFVPGPHEPDHLVPAGDQDLYLSCREHLMIRFYPLAGGTPGVTPEATGSAALP